MFKQLMLRFGTFIVVTGKVVVKFSAVVKNWNMIRLTVLKAFKNHSAR